MNKKLFQCLFRKEKRHIMDVFHSPLGDLPSADEF